MLFALAWSLPSLRSQTLNLETLIEALAQEEGGAWLKVGGVCNISFSAWSDRTELPYQGSMHESVALPIYRLHLLWIMKELKRNGVRVSAQAVGSCWRWGVSGARKRKWVSDYGQRCQNLYDSLKTAKETKP